MDTSFITRVEQNDPTLNELNLKNFTFDLTVTKITDKDFIEFTNALKKNHTITKLTLFWKTEKLLNVLKASDTLTTLTLHRFHLYTDTTHNLFKALKDNKMITVLILEGLNWSKRDEESEKGVRLFSNYLKNNSTLKTLKIRHNTQISHDGWECLTNAVRENNTLTRLCFKACAIDSWQHGAHHAGRLIANVLLTNKTITSLDLSHNEVSTYTLREFGNSLRNNHTFTSLNLSYNWTIHNDDIKTLLNMLRDNYSLTTLRFDALSPSDRSEVYTFVEAYVKRNILRKGKKRAISSVLQILHLVGIPTKDLEIDDETKLPNLFSNLIFTNKIDKKSYFIQMAFELWKTREDPVWLTPEERKKRGYKRKKS
jgi:uncharacterized protein YehS (DUF1456 family)